MAAISSPLSTGLSAKCFHQKRGTKQRAVVSSFKGYRRTRAVFASAGELSRSRGDLQQPRALAQSTDTSEVSIPSEPALPEDDLEGNYDPSLDDITVDFADGTAYTFHTLWLRDACKCESCCNAGMRPAQMSARVMQMTRAGAANVDIVDNRLEVRWDDGHPSSFPLDWLRAIAPYVAKPANSVTKGVEPDPEQITWKADDLEEIPNYHIDSLLERGSDYAKFLEAIDYPGVVIVKGLPQDPEMKAGTFTDLMGQLIGRMNQHPTRDNRHWTISTQSETYENIFKEGFEKKSSLDYAAKEPLLSHTDHSDYLNPAFIVCMHVLAGKSCNSVTDGFAVAKALKETDPEAYEMLTTRNQNFARFQAFYDLHLHKWGSTPVISLDDDGNPKMIRMSEGKRTAFSVPHDEFNKMWAAYKSFTDLLDSPEFQKIFYMEQGDVLVLNNHRTLHGRVYIPGGYRILLGGTFARDPYVNRVRGATLSQYVDTDMPYMCELPHEYFVSNLQHLANM